MHTKMYNQLHKLQTGCFRLALWVELLVAIIIFAGIAIHFIHLPEALQLITEDRFTAFLDYLLEALVGIEVAMMLCRHDLDSIIEVMIFAITKTMIVHHGSSIDIVLGVVAVSILFVVRKFLFLNSKEMADRKKHSDYLQKEK